MPCFAVIARFLPAGARGIGPVLPVGGTIARRWRYVPGGRAAGPIICPFGGRLRRISVGRRRSGMGRLTYPTAVAQFWLWAGSSCPLAAIPARAEQRRGRVESRHPKPNGQRDRRPEDAAHWHQRTGTTRVIIANATDQQTVRNEAMLPVRNFRPDRDR